ncbi:uncharacterized protein [Euwallacea similis]|uniref:uncharacterized protein n=1 Tax=Euwallacea similis TaxID=1736056 RepID=UPI00344F8915
MPSLENLILSALLCAFLVGSSIEVQFTSCGGDTVYDLEITECAGSACSLHMGHHYEMLITLETIAPPLVGPEIHVGLIQFNAYFEQASICINECVSYLLGDRVLDLVPKFDMNVTVSQSLVAMPATLRINNTYVDNAGHQGGFCVETSVDIKT